MLIKKEDLVSVLMFLKDNPSISMESLIDITAIDYPGNEKRFTLVYNLLSVSKNFRIKVKTKPTTMSSFAQLLKYFLVLIGMKGKFGIFLALDFQGTLTSEEY